MPPTLTNYDLKHPLGQGGMATVYLAEHRRLRHRVAVKVLNTDLAHNEHIRKRFVAEAKSLAGMDHPNVVKVVDLLEEGDTVAFVMEYIEGETLRALLSRSGRLDDGRIATLMGQMLDAVGYVHGRKLVHRDIKPSNFMVDGAGRVKLLDFGIAKVLDPAAKDHTGTGTNQQLGTVMYMSPEQVRSTRDVGPGTDIYSLGVVLWEMVMGRKPYDVGTFSSFDIQAKIVQEPLPKTNSVWDPVIQHATAKEPAKRVGGCAEFGVELAFAPNAAPDRTKGAKDNITAMAEPPSMPQGTSRSAHRLAWRNFLIVLLVAIICVQYGYGIRSNEGPTPSSPSTTNEVPSLVVGPTKMNVFYRGVDNPVSISVSGYRDEDIQASATNGSLTKSADGYIMRPGKEAEATIGATVTNPDGSKKPMPGLKFRVKNVPNPSPYFAGKSVNDDNINKADLTAAAGVIAKMENFDFDLKFEVVEYRVTMLVNGVPLEKVTKGAAVSGDMKEMFKKAKPGQKIYIEGIKARGPDGTVRNLGGLSFKVV
jgi:serine/threonine protein kinase